FARRIGIRHVGNGSSPVDRAARRPRSGFLRRVRPNAPFFLLLERATASTRRTRRKSHGEHGEGARAQENTLTLFSVFSVVQSFLRAASDGHRLCDHWRAARRPAAAAFFPTPHDTRPPAMTTNVSKLIQDNNVEYVDLRFADMLGKQHHVTF